MYINQLIKNNGNTTNPCQSVVGDENGVNVFAELWTNYPDLIHIIGIHSLIEWTTDREFDSKEMEAFKAGLAMFPEFMEKCYEERERLKAK